MSLVNGPVAMMEMACGSNCVNSSRRISMRPIGIDGARYLFSERFAIDGKRLTARDARIVCRGDQKAIRAGATLL